MLQDWALRETTGIAIGQRTASPAQVEKYNAILAAAHRIADTGGYDALQMRAISEESGVALATIYRYFNSRDYLAYILGVTWIRQVVDDVSPTSKQPTSLRALRRIIHMSAAVLKEHPNMLRTYTQSMLSSDEFVRDQRVLTKGSLGWEPPPEVKRKDWDTMLDYMDKVYWAGLLRWTYGQTEYDDIARDVDGIATICAKALGIFDR
ncbi:TetR/AcrR family transcriptional regulator [Nocardia noduli]|uniref:TetR/AcrR family transcriptional regulator n=1 Tax=Nocardia noduli TaxID=2815722 RepID=UPI001C237663|nr:TetR family transcriptional regulator [Nocardia noduli]